MYPSDIFGITLIERGRFALNEDANEDTLRKLILEIPPYTRVMFFDNKYPSPSDPGAYVSFALVNHKDFVMNYSNHGWSTKWTYTNGKKLQKYLSRCSDIHRVGAEPFVEMWVFFDFKTPSSNEMSDKLSDGLKKWLGI